VDSHWAGKVLPLRILKRPVTELKCGLSKTSLYDKIQKGKFPKPVKLGPKSVGWIETELDAWIAERVAQRDGGA
jgi:prophage regulatory protein